MLIAVSVSVLVLACQQTQVSSWSLGRSAINNGLMKRFQSASKSLNTATLADTGSQLKLDENVSKHTMPLLSCTHLYPLIIIHY